MATKKAPAPPAGVTFGAAGQQLWKEVHADYDDFEPQALRAVIDACKTADLISALEVSLADNPSRCLGAAKQVVLAPEFAELRQQRTTLANLLAKALNNSRAEDADDRSGPMSRSQSARVAAAARWAR